MKKFLLLSTFLVPAIVFAQEDNKYVISGSIGIYNAPAKVYIYHIYKEKNIIDSAALDHGKFSFSGTIDIEPLSTVIVFNAEGSGMSGYLNRDHTWFYLEKGAITITTKDSLSNAIITGTKTNDEYRYLTEQLMPFEGEAKKFDAQYQNAADSIKNQTGYIDELKKKFIQIQGKENAILKSFILANPDSFLSLFKLISMGNRTADAVELTALYNVLSQRVRDSESAKVFKKQLDKWNITSVGATAPDFTEADVNGKPVKLSSFRGKYVLIDFWMASGWCQPCRTEHQNLVKAFNKYKTKNFMILGVLYDSNIGKEQWVAAIERDSLVWPQVSDPNFKETGAVKLYDVESVPMFFLIGPSGKIIFKNLRGEELQNKLEEVLAK